MAFYDMTGNKLTIQEFVDYYSSGYFIGEDNKIKGISYAQSSEFAEQKVMKIKDTHFSSYIDLARVMAWKIGKIKQKESEEKKEIIYANDWINCESENPKRYKKEFHLTKLSDYILENINDLEETANTNPQECLRLLRNINVKGIGSVYLITLLFFLSHGKKPIYDRFAMAALLANEEDKLPHKHQKISVNDLPGKWDKSFAFIYENEYGDYIKKLDALEYDYVNNRNLDQALWVYGHAFINKRNKRN